MTHDHLGIVGTTVGDKYVVEAAVGEGSFSYVYRASTWCGGCRWRSSASRVSARSRRARAQLLPDFVQEGALLSELSGRSATIVQARDAGTLVSAEGEELPYIVLEWLEGRTLEDILQDQRAIFGPKGWPLEKAMQVIGPSPKCWAWCTAAESPTATSSPTTSGSAARSTVKRRSSSCSTSGSPRW